MPKYLIEVPHAADKESCQQAVRIFLQTGSHFLTHADWGCKDDDHRAWLVVDLDSREEALSVLPSAFRQEARIVELTRFRLDEGGAIMEGHPL